MRGTRLELEALDGERRGFDLRLGQIRELEEKCKAGVFVVLARLYGEPLPTGPFDDIRETIRLGLIGGGTAPSEAWKLVARYVDPPVPITENLMLAKAILGRLAYGAPEELAEEFGLGKPYDGGNGRIDFAAIYGSAAVIGLEPRAVDALELWQWLAIVEGWNAANGGEQETKPPTFAEHRDEVARLM